MPRMPSLAAGALILVVSLISGCKKGPALAPVSGKITINGEPLKTGDIVFMPSSGRMAHGKIQPDGTYQLTTYDTGDGALLGEHKVTIESVVVESNAAEPKTLEEELSGESQPERLIVKERWLVPDKYSDVVSTPLTAKVEALKSNEINFDL